MSRSNFHPEAVRLRQHLRAMRRQARLTQTALAVRLNRTQQWVYKYEVGERRLDVIEFIQIAKAIGFDPSDFLKSFLQEGPPVDASPQCATRQPPRPTPGKPSS